MNFSGSFSIYGMGPAGSDFNGILPGSKQDISNKALDITTTIGKRPPVFMVYLLWQDGL
jgi:hypothetical protein